MEKLNIYNKQGNINQNQNIFDSFNNFILSEDRNIFNKLSSRILFYEMVKHLNGDIVECGVFKGSGVLTWLKILELHEPNSIKKIIGFDFFDKTFVEDLTDINDKELMSQVFNRCDKLAISDISYDSIREKILSFKFSQEKFELVKGNISETSKIFVEQRPGFRISLLYLDLDLDKPTYDTLNNFWDNIVSGGVVVFDEYAYHNWSESNGVDRFIKEKKLKLQPTKIKAPTAFLIKE